MHQEYIIFSRLFFYEKTNTKGSYGKGVRPRERGRGGDTISLENICPCILYNYEYFCNKKTN